MHSLFNTKLTTAQESEFCAWLKVTSVKCNRDLNNDLENYDLRGFWLSGGRFDKRGHMTDTFKKPNHPTFSDESIYNGATLEDGSNAIGGHWNKDGSFTPGPTNLRYWEPEALREYFARVEPGVSLNLLTPLAR